MMATTQSNLHDRIWFAGNLVRVHLDGERTGDAFGLVEATGRRGNMPPLHVHHRDDETFYVLEGRLTLFAAGAEPLELTAGEAGFARRGIPHTYRVESEDVRYLVIGSPAGFEAFAREAGEPAEADEPPPPERALDPVALAECAERYGIEILGPPGMLP
jgi:quercetin dioxygenase-like cupin family protein